MKLKLLLLFLSISSFSQIPPYYSAVDFTKSGTELENELAALITNTHTTQLVYTSGSSGFLDTWTVLKTSDLDISTTLADNVLLIYGFDNASPTSSEDRSRAVTESCHTSSCTGKWVREHVYAKSLGTPNLGTEGAGADAHNLRAIDAQRNNSRGNKAFGAYPSSIPSVSINTISWYPGDEWIGDVARIIMYMHLRYPTQCEANVIGTGASTFAPYGDMPDLFLQWNAQDPPSAFEINRNNVIADAQGNRNPFIDNPYLASLIWNGPEAADSWNVLENQTFQKEEFMLYPTRTTGLTYVQTTTQDDYQIVVYNTLGQLIKQDFKSISIDFSNYANGLYFVHILTDNYQKTFKIIKE